jgi:hypothetical protein
MRKTVMATSIAVLALALRGIAAAVPPDGADGAPLKFSVSASPEAVGAGSETSVTLQLEPKPGIKLNKYPKIKLEVPAVAGLVAAAAQSIGNAAPPPLDQMDTNYFHGSIDPLKLALHVDAQAAKGHHDLHAKLSYFYCVAASGYCAPAKADVTIPITVR